MMGQFINFVKIEAPGSGILKSVESEPATSGEGFLIRINYKTDPRALDF